MTGSGFRFDCEFCEDTISATTVEALKGRGRSHLEANHRTELAEPFAEARAGEPCENDCGYVFPDALDDVAGFECPECGHDHFPAFLERYLYWRIESA